MRVRLALALLALAACGDAGGPAAPAEELAAPWTGPRPRNVVLVSLDTLRADRLGAYGAARATSPAFDALAARGARFSRAVSESPWTLPAHATLLTGLHPLRHGVLLKGQKLGAPLVLLSEVLQQAGYATWAFTGGGFVLQSRGFDQGFERFEASMTTRVATKQGLGHWLAPALAQIDQVGERPFFLFLHCYATHCPYTPPEPFADHFHDPAAEPLELRGLCQDDFTELAPTPGQVRRVVDGYDDCVRWVDDELGQLVAELERRGLMEETLLVVTSDHGEELAEHGTIGHGHSLRPEVLGVPLVFVGPGVQPAVLDDDVALADVVPTVLDLLGLEAPGALDGHSLAARLHGGARRDDNGRAAYVEFKGDDAPAPIEAWVQGDLHLVRDLGSGALELYSLAPGDDPTRDVAAERAGDVEALVERLERRMAELGRAHAEDAGDLPAAELQRLRELGYAGD